MPIFDAEFDTSAPAGAFFWHATTVKSAKLMLGADSLGPVGDGAVGAGFYVTTAKSDYQKAMARRAREPETNFPLILFYVFVPNFYQCRASLVPDWSAQAVDADFVAVQWSASGGSGSFGVAEPSNKMPMPGGKKDEDFKYGHIRGEAMHDPIIIKEISKSSVKKDGKWVTLDPVRVLTDLWSAAQAGRIAGAAHFGALDMEVRMLGPRLAFRRLIMEIAFKSKTVLAGSRIVGAQLFNHLEEPLPDEVTHKGQPVDMKSLRLDGDDPEKGCKGNSGAFNDAVWVDLDKLTATVRALKS